MAWTDDRLDDLASRMDAGFERCEQQTKELRHELKGDIARLRTELKGDIGELRAEVKGDISELRTELKSDIGELRAEVRGDIGELRAEVRGDIGEVRTLMLRFATVMIVVLLGAIVAGALGS